MTIAQADIDRLLAGRAAVDKMRSTTPPTVGNVEAMEATLASLGFDSLGAFDAFNFDMNTQAYTDNTVIVGSCDKCEGYEGTPPCVALFGDLACFHRNPQEADRLVYNTAVRFFREGKNYTAGTQNKIVCPPGHGFHVDPSRKLPFDVTWIISDPVKKA